MVEINQIFISFRDVFIRLFGCLTPLKRLCQLKQLNEVSFRNLLNQLVPIITLNIFLQFLDELRVDILLIYLFIRNLLLLSFLNSLKSGKFALYLLE